MVSYQISGTGENDSTAKFFIITYFLFDSSFCVCVCVCANQIKTIQTIKNDHHMLTFFPLIMQIIFLLQDNAIPIPFKSLK